MPVKRPPPFDTYPPTKLWWNNLRGYAQSNLDGEYLSDASLTHRKEYDSRKIATRIEANGSYSNGLVARLFNYKILDQKAIDIYKYLVNAAIPGISFRLYEDFEANKKASELDSDINPSRKGTYCFICVVTGNEEFCPSLLAHDTVDRLLYMRKYMRRMGDKLWEL